MTKKKKSAEITHPPATYTCPICGNSHKNEELCPIVLNRQKKIKYDSQSYIMGGILLECLERGVDFFQIIKEIAYFMEKLSLQSLSECIYFNADFIVSYFSSAIGCSPFKFYKKLPELALKYDTYIDKGCVDFAGITGVEFDEHNNVLDICMELDISCGPLSDLMDSAGLGYTPHLYLHKVFNGRKPSYHLVMDYYWIDSGHCQKRGSNNTPVFLFSNISFGEHRSLYVYQLYAEKEGKLQEIFESEFDWEEISDAISCSNSVAHDWTLKLDEATKKGLLRWDRSNTRYGAKYSTTYEQTEIIIQLVDDIPQDDDPQYSLPQELREIVEASYPKGDYIRVYENDRKMYHYGEVSTPGWVDAEKHENQGVQLIQVPML